MREQGNFRAPGQKRGDDQDAHQEYPGKAGCPRPYACRVRRFEARYRLALTASAGRQEEVADATRYCAPGVHRRCIRRRSLPWTTAAKKPLSRLDMDAGG